MSNGSDKLTDSEQQKADFRDNGDKLKKYRKVIESELNNRFSIVGPHLCTC